MKDKSKLKEKSKINLFVPKQGKSRFWTPKYMCVEPKSKGCKVKKGTTIFVFILTLSTLIINLIWIIAGIYNTNNGEELIGYQVEATLLGIGLFFLLPFWIVFTIMNSRVKEEKTLRTFLITVGVVGVIWAILYFAI